MNANPRFVDCLVSQAGLALREVKAVADAHSGEGLGLLLALIEKYPKRVDEFAQLWGDSIDVAYVSPERSLIQYDVARRLPESVARKVLAIPLYELNYVVTVATPTPHDPQLAHLLEPLLGGHVSMVFALPSQIRAALDLAYVGVDELENLLAGGQTADDHRRGFEKLGKLAREKAVKEFLRGLFLLAVRNHASDIHIEPEDENVRIRFRQDGVLQEVLRIELEALPTLVNHIKIRGDVDIAENRRPQDGRTSIEVGSRVVDVRLSFVPTIHGTKVVARLLGQNAFSAVPDLEELAFSKSVLDNVNSILASPNGIFFITGPTGSGKTTTLFSALKRLNQPGINIMTIEDPVEYRMPGLNQVQVNPEAGVTFESALRAFLRQDPNVILIGEIRDLETAKIAAQAALTGHLVMATMHTNSALQAVTRLIQIGVEPFLVAPSLIGVMAQRLVRRLCAHCKARRSLTPSEIQAYFEWDGKSDVEICRPVGCGRCNGTGFSGRMAIHEIFLIDEETRELIARKATILDIQRHALERGFQSLRYDGYKKVLRGLTTPEEVDRVMIDLDKGDQG